MSGAFIAFRESVTAYYDAYNQTDYTRFITRLRGQSDSARLRGQSDSAQFPGMDARVDGQPVPVIEHQTKAGMYSIGPYDQVMAGG